MIRKFQIKGLTVLFIAFAGLISPSEVKSEDRVINTNPETNNLTIMCEKSPMESDGIVRLSKIITVR